MTVPARACDSHMHISGDPVRYPAAARRAYDPVPMGLERNDAEAVRMGFSRVVFVQPSAYGTDNTCMLVALRARGASSRGVAVIDDATPDATLSELAEAGTKGVRLNLISNGTPNPLAAIALLQATPAPTRFVGRGDLAGHPG